VDAVLQIPIWTVIKILTAKMDAPWMLARLALDDAAAVH